jgi:hypothetical protein
MLMRISTTVAEHNNINCSGRDLLGQILEDSGSVQKI